MSEYRFLKKLRKIRRRKEIEPQEIFLDKLAAKKEEESGLSEKRLEVPLSEKIILGVFLFFVIFIFAMFCKTFQFQIIQGSSFMAQAEKNKFIIGSIKAERGVIYDINGKQLAFNGASFDLILDKDSLTDQNALQEMGSILNMDLSGITSQEGRYFLIKENLDHQTLILLETKIKELQGFSIVKNSSRYYEDGPDFSHIIGYTGKISADELKSSDGSYSSIDYVGKDGLEKYYEDVLKTKPGKTQTERDAYGNLISNNIVSLPESGDSLVLWIDADLQKKATEELKATLERTGSKSGVIIAQNPKTGGIMALVSIPSYDNNLFGADADQNALKQMLNNPENPLFDRAISGLYPTGSTIKPLEATGVLSENIISPDKKLNCAGEISVTNKYDPSIVYIYHDNAIHGPTDMRKAIAESCNVYFFTVGGGYGSQKGLGPTNIKKYLELFGWAQDTGIDLPGESEGFIPSPEWKEETKNQPWLDGDTYNLAIGQGGILITPIQVVTAFSAIANNGTLFKPHIVKEIIDSRKNVVEDIKPEITRENFIDTDYLRVAREGMREAVTGIGAPRASSVILNSLPVDVAAKTGTAETPYKDTYDNWVTVFGPYDDPNIVITVMIENVKGVQAAALPTAKNILEWYFTR
jgi:penicillin-binding protein 2